MTYRPKFKKQLTGTRLAGFNCGTAATAMAVDRATLGNVDRTSDQIRSLTNDTTGGTNLTQQAYAASRLGVRIDVELGIATSVLWQRVQAGQGLSLSGSSSVTRGTRYQASETYQGNHQWYVNERVGDQALVFDPLADGRRPGIAQSPFWMPVSMVEKFAAMLNLALPGQTPRRLGTGRAYAGFTRDTELDYAVTVGAGPVDYWRVIDGKADRYLRQSQTAGYTRRCTAPRRYPWPGHTMNGSQLYVNLVKITDGPATGRYVAVGAPRVTVRQI